MNAFILAQAAGQGFAYSQILMLVAIVAVFYFFMIRPQQKKQKEAKQFQEGLVLGDKVVTTGGVRGKIVKLEDDTVVIDIDRGSRMTIEKWAINYESSKKWQGMGN